MRSLALAVAALAVFPACRTVRPSPLYMECAELDAARARVFRQDGKLRQVTLSRDQLIIASCGSAADQQTLREALRAEGKPARYRREQWSIERLNNQLREDPHHIAAEAQKWCKNDPTCSVAVVVDDGVEAGPGGAGVANLFAAAFNCGLFHSAAGHFEYTFTAMRAAGFSEEQSRLAATATQDVDDFEWYQAAAHAQVPNYKLGALFLKPPAEARTAFVRWSQCQLKRFADSCGKPAEERLYWLGYALHGVQDLVFHQGMTNAEHAYRDHALGEGVDCHEPHREKWASDVTSALIAATLAKVTPMCGAEMKTAVNVKVTNDLRARLGRKTDRIGLWLAEYFAEGEAFAKVLEDHADQSDQFRLNPHWVTVSTDDRARTRDVGGIVAEISAPPAGDPCAPAQ